MRALFLALGLLVPATLAAQTTAGLRDLLAQFPSPRGPGFVEIAYGDLTAARGLDLSALPFADPDPTVAQLRAIPPGPLTESLSDPATAWRGSVGFGLRDVQRLLTLAAPPDALTLLRLEPGAAEAVPPALAASGYAQRSLAGLTAWARGEDRQLDLAGRNPDDPFRGMLGRAARVQIDGDLIRHASDWGLLAWLAQAPADPALAHPALAPLVDALDGFKGALVQAVLWPDATRFSAADPLAAVTGQAQPPEGPPVVWLSAALADLATGPRATGALILTAALPDAATAEAVRAALARKWATRPSSRTNRTLAMELGENPTITARLHPSGAWVFVIAAEGSTEPFGPGLTRNPVYHRLYGGVMLGDLTILQP